MTNTVNPTSLLYLDFFALLEPIEQFAIEVNRITAIRSLDNSERMNMIREASSVLSRDLEGGIESFTKRVEERKKELQQVLKPSNPELIEQTRPLMNWSQWPVAAGTVNKFFG